MSHPAGGSPVTAAAHSLLTDGRPARSKDAASVAMVMLDAPFATRRLILAQLSAAEVRHIVNEIARETGSFFGLYYDSPSGFTEDVIGDTLWSKQREVLDAVTLYKRTAVPAGMGVGKCVYYRDVIPLADGRRVEAADLVGTEFEVMAWRPDGRQVPRAARAEWNQLEITYRVRTHSGREVTRNAEHPLWAARITRKMKGATSVKLIPEVLGFTPTAQLQVGDLLLVPEQHHAQGTRPAPAGHPELLGYLLGDGGTTKAVTFSQMPGPALDEFTQIVTALGANMVKAHRPYDWAVTTPRGQRNPVLDLAAEWGLRGVKAIDKKLPAAAWELPNDQLAAVMGRLFACDGNVYCARQGGNRLMARVAITLGSEQLIRDVEAAMLRLGVWGYVRHRKVKYQDGHRDAWEWSCRDRDALLTLAEVLDIPGKNAALQRLVDAVTTHPYRAANLWPHRNAPAGYRWEKITEVEPQPPAMTVALEVDGEHTFLTSVVEHNTWLAGRLVAWGGAVNPPGSMVIVTTATRFRQVRHQLWPHIRKAVAKGGLPGETDTTQWKIPDVYGNEVTVAYGFTAPSNDEAAMQGIHGTPKLLLVVDEAGGIAKMIGRGTNNILTGDARMLAIGNPAMNDPGSWFEDLCAEGTNPEVPTTHTIRISTLHSPAITGETAPLCRDCTYNHDQHTVAMHMPDMDWLVRTCNEYGVPATHDMSIPQILEICKDAHPYVVAKVLAMFPTGASNRIIPAQWIDAAFDAPEPMNHAGCNHHADNPADRTCVATNPAEGYRRLCDLGLDEEKADFLVQDGAWVRIGVDVAADGGDEVTIYRAIGDVIHQLHASSGAVNADQVAVAERVLKEIQRAERLALALGTVARVRVKVDKNGIGQGVTSMLQRWGPDGTGRHGAEIVGVMVSELPEIEDPTLAMRPFRKRDEMWLAMRQLLAPDPSTGRGKLRLRVDHQCKVQLSNPKEGWNATGYTVVESKKLMKSRGVDSPDRAEGALLAVYEPYPIVRRKRRGILN